MYKILTLNNISVEGLQRLPRGRYEVASEMLHPDAVLLRSHNMHEMDIPDSVRAVARAGAGVNNIPIDALTARGIPVFNAPGANANAVKELVLAGMLLAARNLCEAWHYVSTLDSEMEGLAGAVEKAKKRFVGFELPGRTLGVVGLGSIGVEVANAALGLGMQVVGFDPKMTVERAWQLSSGVRQARSLDDLFSRSDMVTVHVPLLDVTRGLVSAERLALMRPGGTLLNFARGGIVDTKALLGALESGQLSTYVCDFPDAETIGHDRIISLPHLGASTHEAEANCAVMVAENLREYLECGNIRRSVNFPEADLPRMGSDRITVANANVPNMVGQVSTCLADAGLNIEDLLNKSLGDVAYTIVDLDHTVSEETIAAIAGIEGVLSVRHLGPPEGD
jgi:D-3-phosphoglycerate dehydrogenase